MKNRFSLVVAVVIAIAAAAFLAARRPASAMQDAAGEPQLIAATFRSAWCSACKILEPKLARAMPEFAGQPVEFVEFDFTFGPNEDLAALAAAHGLTRLYEANKGATGFTVLVDADTGAIVDTLTMNFSTKDMEKAIGDALAIASHTDERAAPAPASF
ncbi:MAG TPA: thiol reductase thioredoxin [Parvularcula sp.]|nr:thiol reductase thioredoxin [Parvularcula sp.]HBS36117.1 thiol reductase thioredoxin [Parvularcula sp.]